MEANRTHGFLYRAEPAQEELFGLPLLTSSSFSETRGLDPPLSLGPVRTHVWGVDFSRLKSTG
jgi:hypothetical protein